MRAAATEVAPAITTARAPSHAEIAQRAFELYVSRGGADGCDLHDWLRAEHELKSVPGTSQN